MMRVTMPSSRVSNSLGGTSRKRPVVANSKRAGAVSPSISACRMPRPLAPSGW